MYIEKKKNSQRRVTCSTFSTSTIFWNVWYTLSNSVAEVRSKCREGGQFNGRERERKKETHEKKMQEKSNVKGVGDGEG